MGLDMYLYRKSDKAKDFAEAKAMDDAFWNDCHWDEGAGKFASSSHEKGFEQVAYWRKANMIHGWFERNCGAVNCEYYRVTRKQLLKLLITCSAVLENTKLVDGKVKNGERYEDGKGWVPIIEDGKFIEDPSYAERYLPTCEGFFFGSTNYDQWYVHDVEETVGILKEVLYGCDDDEFYYYPSW